MEFPSKQPVPSPEKANIIHLKRRAWVTSPVLRVLGVDPGLAETGIAVLEQIQGEKAVLRHLRMVSTAKASKKDRTNLRVSHDDMRRFGEVWNNLCDVAAQHEIHAMAVEVYEPWQGRARGRAAGGGFAGAWKTAAARPGSS